jgi:hypothetical protein
LTFCLEAASRQGYWLCDRKRLLPSAQKCRNKRVNRSLTGIDQITDADSGGALSGFVVGAISGHSRLDGSGCDGQEK